MELCSPSKNSSCEFMYLLEWCPCVQLARVALCGLSSLGELHGFGEGEVWLCEQSALDALIRDATHQVVMHNVFESISKGTVLGEGESLQFCNVARDILTAVLCAGVKVELLNNNGRFRLDLFLHYVHNYSECYLCGLRGCG